MIDLNSSPAISSSFRYRKVYEKGKPVHGKNDDFYIKHPPMDLSKRAKIFSPFDALKGYDEALRAAEAENDASDSAIKNWLTEYRKKYEMLGDTNSERI